MLAPLALLAAGAAAAAEPVPTGITGYGISTYIFLGAAALLLTLAFSATCRRIARFVRIRNGRRAVRRQLRVIGPQHLQDSLIPGAYGGIARIDHAALTPAGILCIRALHVNGVVSGSADAAQWTLARGARKRRFLNPVIQNEGRCRAIGKLVGDVPVSNLVVFTGKVEFASPPPVNVITVNELSDYLGNCLATAGPAVNRDASWQKLTSVRLTDVPSRKDFDAQISFG